jgi:DNA-binding HxlR family transcriptional regulator
MQDVDAQWDPDVVGPALTLISGKWVAPILTALHDGPVRRTTLRGCLDGVSDKILTATLRRMERGGLITRITIPSVPIEIDYGLTA